jgi:hypothetical protein
MLGQIDNYTEGIRMGKKEIEAEDLAIQDTLSMGVQERLKLLANLIVDKIEQDLQKGRPVCDAITGVHNG